jgi:iron transport multicopper oxidase
VVKDGDYFPSADAIKSGAAVNNNATIPFGAGKTYKIRIINMSALASKCCLHPPFR